ncbi:hypothetical protein Bbelb_121300 [Branchiostoma belcheri]|nr:hypothetical protein Bbelb_121300 [Branchiostoma belcheri]
MASKMQRSAEFDEQFLTCAICRQHFRDPRILPCLHTFCKECLQLWATKQQPLECPTCRKPVSLPDQGVDGLKSNFYVSNLLDFAAAKKGAGPGVPCQVCEGKEEGARSWCVQCAVLLCESCTNTHCRFPIMKGHQIVTQENLEASEGVPSGFQRKVFCPKHEDQVLTFYCEPCQILVCIACTVADHPRGEKHNPVEIGGVAERKKRDLQELLEKVEPREKALRASLGDVETEISDLRTSADAAIEEATEYFDHLMTLIQDRKGKVVREIGSRRQEVGKFCLQAQKEAMEFALAGLTSASEFCQQALEHGSDMHVIEVEGQARQRVEELLTTPADLTARPSLVVFSEATAVTEFRDAVAKAGRVQVKVRMDTSKCSVEVKPAVVKCTNVSLLTIKDENGQLFPVPKDDVTATLTDPYGQAVRTQVQEKDRGLWEISYTPEVTDDHRLKVKVKGQSVAGSPYDVRVQSSHTPVLTIGTKGSGEGELSDPRDVAVDMDGNIAVLENGNKRVQVFAARTGQSLLCFPVGGVDHLGIDIDSDGQFIVTSRNRLYSTGKQAIRVYSREGKLTKTLKPDCLQDPCGVAVLKDGRMVVADFTQKSCLLLQPDGSLIREIGKGQLQLPWFIAVDESRGIFFVTDGHAHKVCGFDLEGNLKVSFGKEGKNEGELQHPTGITFDPAGNIIVVDILTRRLQVFRPDGTYLTTVAMVKGQGPQGIALTPDGHIAVACFFRNVELYTYK